MPSKFNKTSQRREVLPSLIPQDSLPVTEKKLSPEQEKQWMLQQSIRGLYQALVGRKYEGFFQDQ